MKSLHIKILMLLLGSVFVVSLLVATAGIICAEHVIKEDSVQIIGLTGEEKKQEIDTQLGDIEQAVENVYLYACDQLTDDASLWNDREYMSQYTENIKTVLETTGRSTDNCVAVYLRLNQEFAEVADVGVFLVRKGTQEDFADISLTDISKYRPEDMEHVGWYYEPIERGEPTWLEPYYNANIDVEMISYVIPIYRGDTVIGVIGMDISIDLLRQYVSEVSVYDTGYAFLAKRNGDIVYHKDYPEGIKTEDFDANLQALGEVVNPEREEGKIYGYDWKGQEKKLRFSKLINGMYLIITAPVSEIDAARNELIKQCVVILMLVLICVTLLGIQIVRQITRPLRNLTEVAEKVGAGDLDVEIMCNSNDEVGLLANTMQNMLAQLNKYVTYMKGLAYTDVLTGLLNKQAYNEKVMEINQLIIEDTPEFSLLLLEINDLKHIADTYGRGMGESVVVSVVAIMKQVFGENKVYCISDDSFAVIFMDRKLSEVDNYQKQFDTALQKFNHSRTACLEEVSVVTGYASFQKEKDKRFSDVFVRADSWLYHDKVLLTAKLGMREDALNMLRMVFHKILKVDLSADNYYEIKTYEEERNEEKGYSKRFSEWIERFAATGQVYEEDKKEYLSFVSAESLKHRLAAGETYLSLRYRRKVWGEFRWVQMEIVPSVEYSKETPVIMLYIRDINDSYAAELEYHKELERLTNTDTLTGLFNRHYMTRYCEHYTKNADYTVGVVFCDLNGLKYTNDHLGHSAGDELIILFANMLRESFPNDMCCRMSGDEFVVCVLHKEEEEFLEMVEKLKVRSRGSGRPVASVGSCWMEKTDDIGIMLTNAENAMYEDKKKFYMEFPAFKR